VTDAPAAIYRRDGDAFVPTEVARGPWDPDAQHGGAPAALLATLLEQTSDLPIARITFELLSPVPLVPFAVDVRTVRPGRRISLTEATLAADGRTFVRATALGVRREPGAAPTVALGDEAPAGPEDLNPDDPPEGHPAIGFGSHGVEIRYARGYWREPGPAFAWFRLRVPVIEGEEPTPFARVAAAADFSNGISSVLDWDERVFINPDLTVYLSRYPAGEWVGLDAVTGIDADGVGLAESRLFDERGPIGRAAQALYVAPR
jgi:hypothetical protein